MIPRSGTLGVCMRIVRGGASRGRGSRAFSNQVACFISVSYGF